MAKVTTVGIVGTDLKMRKLSVEAIARPISGMSERSSAREATEMSSIDLTQDADEHKKTTNGGMVKRGRKKLTSMMNRLHVGRSRKSSTSQAADMHSGSQSDESWPTDEDENEHEAASQPDDEQFEPAAENKSSWAKRRKSSVKPGGNKFVLPEEECDIPTFLATKNCQPHIIEETRRLLKERYAKNPDSFYESDYQRMLVDDWTVTRFLLRRRLEPKRTAKLMEECGKFRKQYKMSELKLADFPREFHQAGGLFRYAPDRVGNETMYMRIKMYRRVPEISDLFKCFILAVLEECDVASGGRGTAVVFDLSCCGLQNVDLAFLSWLLSSFRNYCPKGVSYIMVLNLPWILNATAKLAMSWMSQSNRRALRFVQGNDIEEFIAPENLPDYLGGTCKLNYRHVPEESQPAVDICHKFDMTPKQALKIRELFKDYLKEAEEAEKKRQQIEASEGAPIGFIAQATKFAQ